MKIIKILGLLILIILIAGAVIGFMQPKEYKVERSLDIDAPKEIVFKHIQYFSNWNAWSPWKEKDPTLESTVEGTDGASGAVYTWTGDNEKSGSGYMTIKEVKENLKFDFEVVFTAPIKGSSNGYLTVLENKDGSTKTTWGFKGENDFINRIFSIFYDMDASVGPDFERGLELLKEIAESEEIVEEKPTMKIGEELFPKTVYITKYVEAATFAQVQSQEFFATNLGALYDYVKENNIQMVGPPATLYYTWDTLTKTTNVAVAIPVMEGEEGNEEYEIRTVESSPASVADCWGDYSGLGIAHNKLGEHQMTNGIKHKGPVIESYVTDPQTVTNPMEINTKVIYLHE